MNVYRVTGERDGVTTRTPGETSTELLQHSYYYVADSIEQVWVAIAFLRDDPEVTLRSIAEIVGGVTVLPTADGGAA